MNPFLRTPQEMMLDNTGLPHYAGGSSVTAGANQLLQKVIQLFTRLEGRPPNAQEMQELTQHASSFSKSTNQAAPNLARIREETPAHVLMDAEGRPYKPAMTPSGTLTTPEQAQGYGIDPFGSSAANFRARKPFYEDTGVKPMEMRDPFLTQAMTGRPPSGTYQKPFTTSIDDILANKAALEEKGIYGEVADVSPGGRPFQSSTPMSDYLAERAAAIENAAVPPGLRDALWERLGRKPTEDEMNEAIALLNPARHDYTGKGKAIFGERPQQKSEMDAWREKARLTGMSETAINSPPARLRDKFPVMAHEINLGPDTGFKSGGSISPDYMIAEMAVNGHTPKKFSNQR